MGSDRALSKIFLGYDSREAICSDVLAHSINKRSSIDIPIEYMKHRELRRLGIFARPWLTDAATGDWLDLIDGKPFSTEFSHTRFLVPRLMKYKGWALFMDSDMLFLSDVDKLVSLLDDKYAVMVVKHNHMVKRDETKMDGRAQLAYHRKNWSSFIAWNCGHEMNRQLTPEKINFMKGTDLHGFSWLPDNMIGELPFTYNYISGVSPKLSELVSAESGYRPDVIHYTEGGPWFDNCREVPYADLWLAEYEDYARTGGVISDVPTLSREGVEVRRK